MKKGKLYISILLGLCLWLFTAFFTACKEETPPTPTLKSISVSGETEIFIDEFDYADYTITATYSDDSTKTATLTAENLSAEDNAKLSTVGTHALTVNYESVTCSWTVTLKNHEFAGLTFDDVTTTYDGTAKTLAVAGLPMGAQVSYDKATSYTNAGEYTVKATITLANYNPVELPATLTINKATYDMSAVVFADKTVTYNGQAHSIEATNLPNGVTAQYTGNNQINAGEYEITATFTGDSANYEPIASQTATLTINKATYDMSGVVFKDKSVNYTGEVYSLEATNLPNGVTVDYENNNQTQAGEYTVTAIFKGDSQNYNAIPNMTAKLTISASDLTGISFHDGEFIYDGTKKSIFITGTLPDGVKVDYTNNEQINANSYTVTATFTCTNGNYTNLPELTATLTIKKAVYDMSRVVFADKTATYDGQAHSILATNLPQGVTAQYTGNKQINAGEYEITATLTGDSANYEPIASKAATLTIKKAVYDMSAVVFEDKTVTYDGQAHSIEATNLPNGVTAEYTGNKQINAGEYKITVTFTGDSQNYELIASKTATLTIKQRELTLAFDGETTLKYNGKAQKTITVQATNLVDGDSVELTVSYNGAMIEVGEYIATATLTAHKNYKLTENNTVKVTITRATHTVTFKQDGVADIVKEVLDLADLTDIPTPQHVDGYKFTWDRTDFTSITEDITVTANKTVITYTIEYVVYDGVNSESNPTAYTVESATFTLKNPTPSETFGKSFGGWFTSPDFTVENKITKIEKGSFGDLKLYAYWLEYRVTEVVGGTVNYSQATPEITIKVDYGTANLAVKDLIAVSDGCTWKLYNGFECLPTQELTAKRLTVSNIGDNIFYILVYHPDSDEYYADYVLNVYQLDMKAYTFLKDGETWASGEIQEESAVNAPENPEKDGYTFNGWKVNGEFVSFPYTVLTDTTFIAGGFTPITYIVSYELNGGENDDSNPETYNIEQAYTLKNPIRTGYDFKGWFTEKAFENQATEIELGSYGDKKFYAQWTPMVYTIEYELNGGENDENNPETYNIEQAYTLKNPTRTGYDFNGWFAEETFDNQVTEIALGSYGDKKFYAKWMPTVYTIEYELNGGENDESNPETYTIETPTITLGNPTRAGYTFKGWFTEETFENQTTGIALGSYSDEKFYAEWTANLNTLKFDGNGATDGSTAEMGIYTDETATLATNEFLKDYYHFIGWALTPNGEVEYADGAEYTMGTESEYTLYAVWEYGTNGIEYTLSNDGTCYTVSGYSGTETDVKIPSVYNGIAVISIEEEAFYDCNLRSIEIPNSVTSIGESAFSGCSSLTEVYITDIEAWCNISFGDCSANPLRIATNLYLNNELVTELEIPNTITEIKEYAFYNCSSLTSVAIGNGVTSIGYEAFYNCSSLTSVTIGNSVTSIGPAAFNSCSSLTEIVIPDSVVSIKYRTFQGCSSLTSLTIGNGVTSIGQGTFGGCNNLTGVYITDIEAWCNISYAYLNGVNDRTNPLHYAKNLYLNGELVTRLEIPNTITEIKAYAFAGCSSLTSVIIPDSVTSIGKDAFYNCSSLTSAVISDSVTSIGKDAFYYCNSLTIYCETTSKPSGWDSSWNYKCPVYWYSETQKSGCWHYVDGVVTKW